ncbi:hypothetical protein C2U70_22665 [Bradyrhizobium guangdongense]|nr:hypothetical protein [Bradyrhizobium guangdongense]TPQ32140.1 hypothetical protein C2U70_22665 [Bradyrhizobium guangdongense]
MKWFAREKPGDIWDEAIPAPLGDIEAADRIRGICDAATPSAELVGHPGARGKTADERRYKREGERFRSAARVAMEIAMKISDDLMRDDAVRRIVELCMKAKDIETAQILYRAIQTQWIRESVGRDYPGLG